MSKKGQALIEALAGLGLSVLFFVSCMKFLVMAFEEFKEDQKLRQKQICEISGTAPCSSDGGFVLITFVMLLTVLVFAFHALAAIYLSEDFRWKVSNWCFESGIDSITLKKSKPLEEVYKMEKNANQMAPGLIQFKVFAEGPVKNDSSTGLVSESFYKIHWVTTANFNKMFFNPSESMFHLKCGARKVCQDEKCTYSVIADKS